MAEVALTSRLFRFIEALQRERPWGAVLDAGTGVNSSGWIASLPTTSWTAVTAAGSHAEQVRKSLRGDPRPQDRLLVGNWADASLLEGERFDTVVADYMLGAVEAFAPYFQQQLFNRIRPLVSGRLYVVGLDPYVVGSPGSAAGTVVQKVGRLRDAVLLLAGETPYREYPAEWVINGLRDAAFDVIAAKRFAIRYKRSWIDSQIDMALLRLSRIEDCRLAGGLRSRAESLRTKATELCEAQEGLTHGFDYVIAAEPAER